MFSALRSHLPSKVFYHDLIAPSCTFEVWGPLREFLDVILLSMRGRTEACGWKGHTPIHQTSWYYDMYFNSWDLKISHCACVVEQKASDGDGMCIALL
jgi:hypothetical protein